MIDWSSDVCSSDLSWAGSCGKPPRYRIRVSCVPIWGAVAVSATTRWRETALKHEEQQGDDDEAGDQDGTAPGHISEEARHLHALLLGNRLEIGREPCRARVCRYV